MWQFGASLASCGKPMGSSGILAVLFVVWCLTASFVVSLSVWTQLPSSVIRKFIERLELPQGHVGSESLRLQEPLWLRLPGTYTAVSGWLAMYRPAMAS